MLNQIALTVGWFSVAFVIALSPTTASAADNSVTCSNATGSASPIVADRVGRTLGGCAPSAPAAQKVTSTQLSEQAAVLAECVRAARRDGLRTADRLEYAIQGCVTERISQPGSP